MNNLAFVVQIHVQFAYLVTREVLGVGGGEGEGDNPIYGLGR